MHYKDTQNNIHVLDSVDFEHLLPQGAVQITSEEAQAILSVITTDIFPLQPKQLSSLSYLDLFTETEQLQVVTATMQSAQVKLWYDKMLAAEYITLADARTEQGLDVLVSLSLLTPERKAQIITAMQ